MLILYLYVAFLRYLVIYSYFWPILFWSQYIIVHLSALSISYMRTKNQILEHTNSYIISKLSSILLLLLIGCIGLGNTSGGNQESVNLDQPGFRFSTS